MTRQVSAATASVAGNPQSSTTHSKSTLARQFSTGITSSLADALRDRYVLERELGRGGMATVYLAEDVRHRRRVAVKVLRPELAATLGSDRSSARSTSRRGCSTRTSCRCSTPVRPAASTSTSCRTSRESRCASGWLGTGELPVDEAVRILLEVVDALAAAHAAGVVHRDIKPDNVMLSGRHALVMDFGVAKAVSEATGRHQLTSAGVALGTPAYMAPEQAAADPHLDHRVDIYAVGALAYELLTGHPPFSGGSSQEVLAAHMTRAPEPVSSRRPAVPPALAAVVMKCLEKRPADRYQTAEELLAQLEPLAIAQRRGHPDADHAGRGDRAEAGAGMGQGCGSARGRGRNRRRRRLDAHPPREQDCRGDRRSPRPGHQRPARGAAVRDDRRRHRPAVLQRRNDRGDRGSALEAVSPAGGERQRDRALPRTSRPASRMDRELGVRNVVEGSVRVARERVRVGVRLTETRSGRTIWSDQYDRDLTDVFAVQSEVARRIAEALEATLTPGGRTSPASVRRPATSPRTSCFAERSR